MDYEKPVAPQDSLEAGWASDEAEVLLAAGVDVSGLEAGLRLGCGRPCEGDSYR